MEEKGEIKSVSSTTVQGGVEMYTYWYKTPDGIYRTQGSFRTYATLQRLCSWTDGDRGHKDLRAILQRESFESYQRASAI